MTDQQKAQMALAIVLALLDTVKEMGANGAPAGPMYAAVMGHMSLDTFESAMSLLVRSGKVRKEGHVYFYVQGVEVNA